MPSPQALVMWTAGALVALIGLLLYFIWRYRTHEWNAIRDAIAIVRCYGFILWWQPVFRASTWLRLSARGTALLGAVYVLVELSLPSLRAWTHLPGLQFIASLPPLPAPPLWIEFVMIGLAFIVTRHHYREMKQHEMLDKVPAAALAMLAVPRGSPGSGAAAATTVLDEARKVLTTSTKRRVELSILKLDVATSTFVAEQSMPPSAVPTTFTLPANGSWA